MQKKFTLAVIAALFSLTGFSQFEKGTKVVHFNFGDITGLSLANKANWKNKNISFNPGVGYFIKKNWEVGANINFNSISFSESGVTGINNLNSKTLGANLYTNYYLGQGRFKPYLTLQGGWNYSYGKYSGPATPLTRFSNDRFYMAIGGGLNYNISRKVSLFAEATFHNTFGFYGQGRLNATFGARFFFGRKNK